MARNMILDNSLSRAELKNFILMVAKVDENHVDMFTISSVFKECPIIVERIKVYGSAETIQEIEVAIQDGFHKYEDWRKYEHPKFLPIAGVFLRAVDSPPPLKQLCSDIEFVFKTPLHMEEGEEGFDWGKYLAQENITQHDDTSDDSDQWSELSDDEKVPDLTEPECSNSKNELATTNADQNLYGRDLQSALNNNWIDFTINRVKKQKDIAEVIQPPYWLTTRKVKEPNVTSHPSALFSYICENFEGTSKTNVKLSEYQVVREILWTLMIPSETYLFNIRGDAFQIRRKVTIPSMSEKMFRSCIEENFLKYFMQLKILNSFVKDVTSPEKDNKYICGTYKSYAYAIFHFLKRFSEKVVVFENEIRKQEKPVTVISLSQQLSSDFELVNILYETHIEAIAGCQNRTNWFCATKLLCVYATNISTCQIPSGRNIILEIFLSSFSIYLNIIQTFSLTGTLKDTQKEFILEHNSTVKVSDDTFWSDGYNVHNFIDELEHSDVDVLCLLEDMLNVMLSCGKSAELVSFLDVRAAIQEVSDDTLFSKLKNKMSIENETKENEVNFIKPNSTNDEDSDSMFTKYIIEQISYSGDKFLLQQYKTTLLKEPTNNSEQRKSDQLHVELREPLEFVLHQTIMPWLENHAGNLWILLLEQLKKLKLFEHLKMLQCVYLFEAGDAMHFFCESLFQMVESKATWNREFVLNSLLDKSLTMCYDEQCVIQNFTISIEDEESSIESLHCIKLEYLIPWPINVIVTKQHLKSYQRIFAFLLDLRWGLYELEHLQFKELDSMLNDDELIQRMQMLRMWLLFFLKNIHTYCLTSIMENTQKYNQQLKDANNLDSIIRAHEIYITSVHSRCIQHPSANCLRVLISKVIQLALKLTALWKNGNGNLPLIANIEKEFCRAHSAITYALQTIYLNLEDQELGCLSTALSESFPQCIMG